MSVDSFIVALISFLFILLVASWLISQKFPLFSLAMDRSRSRTRSAGPPYAPVSAPTPLSGVSRHLVWNATSIQDEGPLLPPTSFAKASQPYHAAVVSQGSYTWILALDSSSGTKKTTVLHAASLIFSFFVSFRVSFFSFFCHVSILQLFVANFAVYLFAISSQYDQA